MEENYSQKVDFYELDCTNDEARSLCVEEYDVKGFPTLIYFPIEAELKNSYISYEGEEREL